MKPEEAFGGSGSLKGALAYNEYGELSGTSTPTTAGGGPTGALKAAVTEDANANREDTISKVRVPNVRFFENDL